MKRETLIFSGMVLIVLMGLMATGFTKKRKMSIKGSWKIAEVQTVKPDHSYTSVYPNESSVFFTETDYSFCWTSNTSTSHTWQMTDSEKMARMNESIVNSGSYGLSDSVLVTKASFALNPMFVNGAASFRCSYAGDTLILTGLNVYSSGQVLHPLYAAGSHIVNKLVRQR